MPIYSAGSNKYSYSYTVLQVDWKALKESHCDVCARDIPAGQDIHVFRPSVPYLGFQHRCANCASKDASFKPRERLVFNPKNGDWTREPI